MSNHLPVLMVVIPLSVAVILPLLALTSPVIARLAVLATLILVCLCSTAALVHVLQHGPWHYHLGGWPPPWGIEYVIDPLSGGIATLIACLAFLATVYGGPHMSGMSASRTGTFYSLFLLLFAGLLGMIVTGDLFNLYVFFEISSLAAYALLASGGILATLATFRYLIVGTIAATFYLLGVGYLYAITGTLNMADLAARVPTLIDSRVFVVAVSFIVVGLAIKTALFPLHGWLPDAYTYAPAPVVTFISAVMAKVSAYVLFRVLYFVLRPEGAVGQALMLLGWASAVAVLAGSLLAIAQQDVRRMLAYSSIGQMGYIALGLSIGNSAALIGALLHMLHHAIMKGCLFMIVGGIQWRTGICRIDEFVGLSRRMPLTMLAFVVAALSMIGLPPTAGFFSKWYLISGALQAGAWFFVIPLIGSSLLSAVYFFRIIETSFLQQPDGAADSPESGIKRRRNELPLPMLTPIIILATAVLILGLMNHAIITHVIRFALPQQVL